MTQPRQQQDHPGIEAQLNPRADHGVDTYRGCGRLEGKVAIITGGDSGIGRAVAIAFAREGADVFLGYLEEHADAEATAELVRDAGRSVELFAGDLSDPATCRNLVQAALDAFGRLDILVNNAAYQMARPSLE